MFEYIFVFLNEIDDENFINNIFKKIYLIYLFIYFKNQKCIQTDFKKLKKPKKKRGEVWKQKYIVNFDETITVKNRRERIVPKILKRTIELSLYMLEQWCY